ncbi:MAG: hypothetical protein V3U02_10755 [Calditrichia bacterium]
MIDNEELIRIIHEYMVEYMEIYDQIFPSHISIELARKILEALL